MTKTLLSPRDRILVALDVPALDEALALVHALRGHVGGFKVGLELCTSVGVPMVVAAISGAGGAIFLDLKFKDIPNTVASAVRVVATTMGASVRMLTLHTDGGSAMLAAAAGAVRNAGLLPPLLLGVTVLTSTDEVTLNEDLRVPGNVETHVVHLARIAQRAGLGGVVASPLEVAAIRAACGDELTIVTPGVRPSWATSDDQRRVMTPTEALRVGSDYLVIGRPITAPPVEIGGPAEAARRILRELETAMGYPFDARERAEQ
ncbi:orotidine-5'-phosphate decarboxylase [Candidatus Gracilibacteria bacterium]|nr:orotidine-5'-phosphate decarboxylase [Candidatus Gracilibacteria bacterium]